MANYWIQDSTGSRLGPLALQVITDLVNAGRLQRLAQISLDGKAWQKVENFPDIYAIVNARAAAERKERQLQDAERVRLQLDGFKEMPINDVFKVPITASARTYRQAFLIVAKPFHPARLPQDVHPELLRACIEMFQYLSGQMVLIDRREKAMLSTGNTPTPLPSQAPKKKEHTYNHDEFIGVARNEKNQFHATVRVNHKSANMFTEHNVVNWRCGGFFISSMRTIPIGTHVELLMKFEEHHKEIKAKATVVYENVWNNGKQAPGYGLRFDYLSIPDKDFIGDVVEQYRMMAPAD